jgi:carbamoyltransferase
MPTARPTYILGISAFYHDSAAALVRDGEIVAAAQEERFTRKKHDPGFPTHAVDYCLREAGIGEADLAYLAFYEKPLVKFDRLIETYLAYAPRGFASFRKAVPVWLKEKLHQPRQLRTALPGFRGDLLFLEHHESHAASAFFPSPFQEAAILTIDGVGEWATGTVGVGRGNRITLQQEMRFPHSLGLLYSAFTYYTGFKVNSGEYKVMGLAPYGDPKYKDLILTHLIDLKDDGSFRLDMRYFGYCDGLEMTNRRFHDLFGGPPRQPESKLTQRDMDLAASVQAATEEIVLRMARHVHRRTGMKNLCLAGGVALNCVANGRILEEGPFERLWIQPAAGDAGGALGSALFVWYQLLDRKRPCAAGDHQKGSLLGPRFDTNEICAFLDRVGASYRVYAAEELESRIAALIAGEKVVGLFQGRMEFGPRALGGRSIIGDARSDAMQSVMNLKIKFRESFRPFAPAVLREHAGEYFDFNHGAESPYMLLVAPVAATKRLPHGSGKGLFGLDLLKLKRSVVPAITHIDYSARLQTVDAERHGMFHGILERFEESTGCPLVINTSFNVRGEPIVCTPEDALRCFMNTDIDALVLENCVLMKDEQPSHLASDRTEYLSQFKLD